MSAEIDVHEQLADMYKRIRQVSVYPRPRRLEGSEFNRSSQWAGACSLGPW